MTQDAERRILVYGASGAIGACVCARAGVAGLVVGAVSRSGLAPAEIVATEFSEESARDVANAWRPDAVIYAAGLASVGATEDDPEAAHEASVAPLLRVLAGLARAEAPPTVAFISSAAVYGEPERLPVPETARIAPISAYGRQRVACEAALEAYARETGAAAIAARAFSLFGPAQKKLLVWELFRQLRDEPEVIIQGTGDETRDYLSLDAFCDRVLALALIGAPGFQAVNVASGRGTRVADLAESLRAAYGSDKPIRRLGRERPQDPKRWIADVTLLEALLAQLAPPPPPFDFEHDLNVLVEAWR